MVELEPTETVVRDPKAGKDAVSVAFPDVRPHGRRDRVRRAGPAGSGAILTATQVTGRRRAARELDHIPSGVAIIRPAGPGDGKADRTDG